MSIAEILKKLHEIVGLNKWDRPLERDDKEGGADDWKDKGLLKEYIHSFITDEKERARKMILGPTAPKYRGTADPVSVRMFAQEKEVDKLVQEYKSSKGVSDTQARKAIDAMLYAYANADGDMGQVSQYSANLDKNITDMITGDNENTPLSEIYKRNFSNIWRDDPGKNPYTHTPEDLGGGPGTQLDPKSPLTEEKQFQLEREKEKFGQAKADAKAGAEKGPLETRDPLGTTDLGGDPFGMDLSPEERAYSGLTRKEIAAGLPLTATGGASPYARRTYQNLLNPLAQDNGVFSFLETAGLTPRVALPGQPDVTNEALSFRAFLAQGPNSMANNINQGLGILEQAKELAFTDNQKFWTDPTYATDLQKTLYTKFVDNPGNELALRQSLARRAYPGELGDVIAETLAKTYFATQATDPFRLTQPGFYKNAFQNYLPTTKAKNILPAAASVVDEGPAKPKLDANTEVPKDVPEWVDKGVPGIDDMPSIIPGGAAREIEPMPWEEGDKGVPLIEDIPPVTTPPSLTSDPTDIGGDPFGDLLDREETRRAAVPGGAIDAPEGTPGGGFIDPATYNDPRFKAETYGGDTAQANQAFKAFQDEQRAGQGLTQRRDEQGNLLPFWDKLPEGQRVITDPVTGQTRLGPALPVSDTPPVVPGMVPGMEPELAGKAAGANLEYEKTRQDWLDTIKGQGPQVDIGGDPFAYLEDLQLAEEGMGSQPTITQPPITQPSAADEWIEPGIADMPGASPMGRLPRDPRNYNPAGEMIGERMADRQPGPLMPGGKAYTTGELVSLANQLGTDPRIGVTGGPQWDWASPEATSSMINFPSPVSAADIQDIQRRGITNPSVNPRLTFEDYNPYMMGADQPAPGIGQTEMFGERHADRPAGMEFATMMDIQQPDLGGDPFGTYINKAARQGLTDFSWRDDPAMRAFSEIYAPLTTQIPLGPLGDLNPMNTALNMMTPALMNLAGRINPDDLGNLYTRPVSPGVIPGQDPFTVSPTMATQGQGPTYIDDFKRRANLFSSFVR